MSAISASDKVPLAEGIGDVFRMVNSRRSALINE